MSKLTAGRPTSERLTAMTGTITITLANQGPKYVDGVWTADPETGDKAWVPVGKVLNPSDTITVTFPFIVTN